MTEHASGPDQRNGPPDGEERYRLLFDHAVSGIWLTDASGRFIDVNPAALRMLGRTREEMLATSVDDLLPDGDAGRLLTVARAAAADAPAIDRSRARHADGRWIAVELRHALTGAGLWQAVVRDMDARNAATSASRELETLIDGIPQLVWRAGDGGNWTWASPQWRRLTGQTAAQSLGHGWLEALHPDDRADALAFWRDAERRGQLEMEGRICHAQDGRYRWFKTRATAVRDEDGAIVQWLGTSTDIDDLRRLQDHQHVLVAELQHRVRNMLTIVRSVFNRTVAASGPLDEVVDHFRGRLDSLARTQVIVTQASDEGIDLEDLIRDELLSVGIQDGGTLAIEGPEVRLPSRGAETIALAVHELTTNAVKYGALRISGASLSIRWRIIDQAGEPTLELRWVESGVPAVPIDPARDGFGRELIEQALPYRLGARTTLEFRGGGVRCTILLPLSDDRRSG